MAKELRFFYTPNISSGELPPDEAQHALRVLRLGVGDGLNLMDGTGSFYEAEITAATGHKCLFRVVREMPQPRPWRGHIHLAMAPTKLNDRTEWFVEKATEIGCDEFSFLNCQFSERRVLKTDRVEKIVVSAAKQSHKAWMPQVGELTPFRKFIEQDRAGQKFICHCYDQSDVDASVASSDEVSTSSESASSSSSDASLASQTSHKPHLFDVLSPDGPCTVLIGPEGDFSIDEVRLAQQHGYVSVSLGTSRLRTETAALTAVHIMQLKKQI